MPNVILVPIHAIPAGNEKEFQAGYLAINGTRTMRYSIHFYTNAGVLVPYMMFHDAKPQIVKTAVKGLDQAQYHQITHANVTFITNTKLQYKPNSFFHCTLLTFKVYILS